MARMIRCGLILGLGALLGAGLALADEKKGAPKDPKKTELAKSAAAAAVARSLTPVVSEDYHIGVNDVLDIHVWKEPELSRVLPVRPDGKISLPLVGELQAERHTALEVRDAILQRLKDYVTQPEVTVIVREINSQRYFIIGEVQNPGVYPLTVPTNAIQALAMAGGFREFADTEEIVILRRADGDRTIRITFNYKDWIKNKKQPDYFMLQNGDVIVVP